MRTLRGRVWGLAGLFSGDADFAAFAVGRGEVGLGRFHCCHVGHDVFGHGGDFGGVAGLVDVEGEGFACGGQPTVGVPEFLEDVEAFGVIVDQVEGGGDAVGLMKFAHIADVEFGDVRRAACAVAVVGAEAQQRVRLVRALVHQHRVVGHVEVAVVVDPFGQDGHGGGAECVCHGSRLA